MTLSPQDFDLVRKVAEGKESFSNKSFEDILDDDAKPDVFKWMISEVPLSEEQRADLERNIIDDYVSLGEPGEMWDFDNGYLRHRFVAEGVSHDWWLHCDSEFWFERIIQYIFTDYTLSDGEPSKEQLILYIVKSKGFEAVPVHIMIDIIRIFLPYYYEEPSKEQLILSIVKSKWYKDDPVHLIIDINKGVFDQLNPTDKEEALKLLLDRCNSDEDGPSYEDVIFAWVKRGLLSGMYWFSSQLRRLKDWVISRPDMYKYLEAGLWESLSVHERTLMIAPYLDQAESAIQVYTRIIQFLRLEKPSPLLAEVKEDLDRLFKAFFYETIRKNDLQ